MLGIIRERLSQRGATIRFPEDAEAMLPSGYRGRPHIGDQPCAADCVACQDACPTDAIVIENGTVRLDLGRCLFCGECARICPAEKIEFTRDYRMAVRQRADLWIHQGSSMYALAQAYEDDRFRKSFRVRQVSAGGSGAEEADFAVLQTVVFDVARWGIQIVAAPRHADGIVVTGPVTTAMRAALHITHDAVPAPKLLIAIGASAISGGPWRDRPEVVGGVTGELPVDLFIPGFPPHPLTILDGLLRLLGRV